MTPRLATSLGLSNRLHVGWGLVLRGNSDVWEMCFHFQPQGDRDLGTAFLPCYLCHYCGDSWGPRSLWLVRLDPKCTMLYPASPSKFKRNVGTLSALPNPTKPSVQTSTLPPPQASSPLLPHPAPQPEALTPLLDPSNLTSGLALAVLM